MSINFEWSRHPDYQVIVTVCPVTITFFKTALHCIVIMNQDIGKFGYDSVQQRKKKDKNYEKDLTIRTFKVKVLPNCNVFVFCKNLLCHLRSSCSRYDRVMDSMM